jgi:hypothetical protein
VGWKVFQEKKVKLFYLDVNNTDEFEQLLRIIRGIKVIKPIFRGQPDYNWGFLTNLEALIITEKGKDYFRNKFSEFGKIGYEKYILDAIKNDEELLSFFKENTKRILKLKMKTITNLRNNLISRSKLFEPKLTDLYAWLQHYGFPTRLLDFTWNFDIALYFMTRGLISDHPSALWIINEGPLFNPNLLFKTQRSMAVFSEEDILKQNIMNKDAILENRVFQLVFNIGFIQNDRINRQEGLFMYPANFNKSFQDNLFQVDKKPNLELGNEGIPHEVINIKTFQKSIKSIKSITSKVKKLIVYKIKIQPDLHEYIKDYLVKKGITYEYLFPDFENKKIIQIAKKIEKLVKKQFSSYINKEIIQMEKSNANKYLS